MNSTIGKVIFSLEDDIKNDDFYEACEKAVLQFEDDGVGIEAVESILKLIKKLI